MFVCDPHASAGPGPTRSRDEPTSLQDVGAQSGQARHDRSSWRSSYLLALTWGFTLFSAARIVSYLPTLWAICSSGESSQHSLWTWGIWLGSNLTMAAWLYEQAEQRVTRAAMINVVNAAMCAATCIVILVFQE